MELNLKLVPIGSTLMLGGDTAKRTLYLGGMVNGFFALYKSKEDYENNQPWQVLAVPSTRIKNVKLPIGFDIENVVGWARGLVQ